MTDLALGIDLGTSGIRSAVIDGDGTVIASARADHGKTDPDNIDANAWWHGVSACLSRQVAALNDMGLSPQAIRRIGVDGTSGTMVLTDHRLAPVTRALMYNSGGFHAEAEVIGALATDPHITRGSNSATARALRLLAEADGKAHHLLHQADFIAAKLMGRGGVCDYNNALKTGYDKDTGGWPAWFDDIGLSKIVPECLPAGSPVQVIDGTVADHFGLSRETIVHVGTTDSIAAFLATAPLQIGAAVTSLGTTLAIKLLSDTRIDAPNVGLYSHPLGDGWLVGGASNTGGGVLRSLFSDDQLAALSNQIDPSQPSDLDYYPLLTPGERFPVNDPDLAPRMSPRPADDAAFLHGVFESIARIEHQCYQQITEYGGPLPSVLFTAGGGASNPVWTTIRERVLGRKIQTATQTEAAVGIARLINHHR